MENILSVRHLDVGYDKRSVISDINIEAVRGQIICLLGPNGAGKSTILRTLAGLIAPINGTVYLCEDDIAKSKKADIAKKMSLVLTEGAQPSLMTVYDIVSMGRTPYTDFLGRLSDADIKIIDDAIKTVGVSYLSNRYLNELSDGEKQKVMIARALVQEPELIILDEPTSHLDIKHKVEVIRILQKLVNDKKITCILSLHDIDLALKGCETVLLTDKGKIIKQGSPEEIFNDDVIQKLYDIKNAQYNELLGTVEFKGNDCNDIFVVGGNGSGIKMYRALSRKGYGLTAGVIHRNDTEYTVAESICCKVIIEEPFECISDKSITEAFKVLNFSKCIVDSGFQVGSGNYGNVLLIKKAAESGKKIYTLRSSSECQKHFGASSKNIICVSSITKLMEEIEQSYKLG